MKSGLITLVAALSLLALNAVAAEVRPLENITGFGESEYFNIFESSANVLLAHRLDGVQRATEDSVTTLAGICSEWGGAVAKDAIVSKLVECELENSHSGSLRGYFRCRAESSAKCIIE